MLDIHFINVADGDSILIEEREPGKTFRMLVDTGRAVLASREDSLRLTAAEYLREKRISHLDVLVITHLHIDHFGGLRALLPEVRIDDVYAGFFPDHPGTRIPDEPDGQKTVRGMIDCVNRWAEDVEQLRAKGCRLHPISDTLHDLSLTSRLCMDLCCPNRTLNAVQKRVWEDMLSGQTVPEDLKYWTSKSRNPGSLRLRLRYEGRSVELAGDCYGEMWEREALAPCDIFKTPHHCDAKALTPLLVQKLRPAYAVISCGADYIAHKDRPSEGAVGLLREQGAQCWFTDSFSASWQESVYWNSIDFTILENGEILTPSNSENGGR